MGDGEINTDESKSGSKVCKIERVSDVADRWQNSFRVFGISLKAVGFCFNVFKIDLAEVTGAVNDDATKALTKRFEGVKQAVLDSDKKLADAA